MNKLARLLGILLLLGMAACGGEDDDDLNVGVEPAGELLPEATMSRDDNTPVDEASGPDGDIFGEDASGDTSLGVNGEEGELFANDSADSGDSPFGD